MGAFIAVGDRSYREGAIAEGYRGRRPLLQGGGGVFVGALAERDWGGRDFAAVYRGRRPLLQRGAVGCL